jgi:hypothetical protein
VEIFAKKLGYKRCFIVNIPDKTIKDANDAHILNNIDFYELIKSSKVLEYREIVTFESLKNDVKQFLFIYRFIWSYTMKIYAVLKANFYQN